MKTKLKQRIISFFMAVVMALGMLPAGILPAYAADVTAKLGTAAIVNGKLTGKIQLTDVSQDGALIIYLISDIKYSGEASSVNSEHEKVIANNGMVSTSGYKSIEKNFSFPVIAYSIPVSADRSEIDFDNLPADTEAKTANGALTIGNIDKISKEQISDDVTVDGDYEYYLWINNGNRYCYVGPIKLSDKKQYTLTAKAEQISGTDVGGVSIGGGTPGTSVNATKDENSDHSLPSFSIVATPDSGYHFLYWKTDGNGTFDNSTSASTTYTPAADKETVTAVFEEDTPASLTISPASGLLNYNAIGNNSKGEATEGSGTLDSAEGTVKFELINSGDRAATVSIPSFTTTGITLKTNVQTVPGYDRTTGKNGVVEIELEVDYAQVESLKTFTENIVIQYTDNAGTGNTVGYVLMVRNNYNTIVSSGGLYFEATAGYTQDSEVKAGTLSTDATAGNRVTVSVESTDTGDVWYVYDKDRAAADYMEETSQGNHFKKSLLTNVTGYIVSEPNVLDSSDYENFFTEGEDDQPEEPEGGLEFPVNFTFKIPTGLAAGTYNDVIRLAFLAWNMEETTVLYCDVPITVVIKESSSPVLVADDLIWKGVPTGYTPGTAPAGDKTLTIRNTGGADATIASAPSATNFDVSLIKANDKIEAKKFKQYTIKPNSGLTYDNATKESGTGRHIYTEDVEVTYDDGKKVTFTLTVEMIGTITFDPDYPGATTSTGYTNTYGQLSSLPTPKRNGWDFKGWYTEKNGGGTKVDTSTVFDEDTTVYAKWEEIVTDYTAQVTVKLDGTASNTPIGTNGAVYLGTDTTATTNKFDGGTDGVYTKSDLSDTYTEVTVVTADGGKYTFNVSLSRTGTEATVDLYTVTISVDTTISNSTDTYGTATATTVGNATGVTATEGTDATLYAPAGTEVTLSNTPDTDYTFAAYKKGDFATGVTVTSPYTVAVNASATDKNNNLTAYFEPHARLTAPATASGDMVEGATSATTLLNAGTVTNAGTATSGELCCSVTNADTFSTTSATTELAALLKATLGSDAALAPTETTTLTIGATSAGSLSAGTHTAYVWVYAKDNSDSDAVDIYTKVTVTVTIKTTGSLTATEGPFTWDTYTEPAETNEVTLTIGTDSTDGIAATGVNSVKIGTVSLTASADYVATKVDTNNWTLKLTKAGAARVAEEIINANSGETGTLTVTVKNLGSAEKSTNVTMELSNTMPALKSATFSDSTWALGSTQPTLTVTDDIKDSTSLTGKVVYSWELNRGGATQTLTSDTYELNATDLTQLQVDDVVTVTVKGTGKDWDPTGAEDANGDTYWGDKPTTTTNLYKASVSQTASYTVVNPEVTVQISVDLGTTSPTVTTAPYKVGEVTHISGSAAENPSHIFGVDTKVEAEKYTDLYKFVGWTVDENPKGTATGNFGQSGTGTTLATQQGFFRPSKASTITANWMALGKLAYGHGATGSGPNDDKNTKYSETISNVGPIDSTVTTPVLSGDDAKHFTLETTTDDSGKITGFEIKPKSDKDAPTAGNTYTLKVTTTYVPNPNDKDGDKAKTNTITQTIEYTVPLYVTLTGNVNGVLSGSVAGGASGSTETTPANATIKVAKNAVVAVDVSSITAGYKFKTWSVTAGDDKFIAPKTQNNNSFGLVTGSATLAATIEAVTDIRRTDESTTSATVSEKVGKYSDVTVYSSNIWNAGALDEDVDNTKTNAGVLQFELKDEKKDSADGSGYFTLAAPSSLTSSGTILAKKLGTSTSDNIAVTVKAANNLGVGTYTAKLVITELTDNADTMSGTAKEFTIDLTFEVEADTTFAGEVTVELDGTYLDGEAVTLQCGNENAITMTAPASGGSSHSYTAAGLDSAKTYNVLLNGVDTGFKLTAASPSAAIKLYSLTTSVNPAGAGTTSAAGATKYTTVAGKGGSGYLAGATVKVSASSGNLGYSFQNWEETSTAKGMGWTDNKTTDSWFNVKMTQAFTFVANYTATPKLIYHRNDGTDISTNANADAVPTTVYITDETSTAQVTLYPAITRNGYTFKGWYTATTLGNGTAMAGGDNKTVKDFGTKGSDGNYHLYAIWEMAPNWAGVPVPGGNGVLELSDGTYGTTYSKNTLTNGTCYAASGTGYYAVTSGSLPAGLTLNDTTGEISGKPQITSDAGISFTVGFYDKKDGDDKVLLTSQDYTIKVKKYTPVVSDVSYGGVAHGVSTNKIKITAKVTAPLYFKKTGDSAEAWHDMTYQFTDYVENGPAWGTSKTDWSLTTTPSSTGTTSGIKSGNLALTATNPNVIDSNGKLDFDTYTDAVGTVTFTPSGTPTGYTPTQQSGQKYEDIYEKAAGTANLNPDQKTYNITIDPTTYGWTASVGDTLSAATGGNAAPKDFDVYNKGNQDAYVVYELTGADKDYFTLTPSYNHTSGTGDKTTDFIDNKGSNDSTKLENAFTVTPNLTGTNKIDTSIARTYTVTVVAKNFAKADPTTSTDTVYAQAVATLTFTITAQPYTAKVHINTTNVDKITGTDSYTANDVKNPSATDIDSKVIFTPILGGNLGGNTATGTWTANTTGSSDGTYQATLEADTLYKVTINGFDVGFVGPTSRELTATLYEVKLATESGLTTSHTGPGYLLPGQTGTITAGTVTSYNFSAWKQDSSTSAYTTMSSFTYQMSSTAPAATTFTAYYKQVDTQYVYIIYDGNAGITIPVPAATEVEKGKTGTVTPVKPVRPGYTFGGWNTKADGTGTAYAPNAKYPSDTDTMEQDVTLYAVWTKEVPTWPAKLPDTTYSSHYSAGVVPTAGLSVTATYTLVTSETLAADSEVPVGATIVASDTNKVKVKYWNGSDWSSTETELTTSTKLDKKAKLVTDNVTVTYNDLPGGLTMSQSGVISGRPYEVGTKNLKIKASYTSPLGETITWETYPMSITVGRYTPSLGNIIVSNAKLGQAFSTATITTDVLGPILKYKEGATISGSNTASEDIWSDDSNYSSITNCYTDKIVSGLAVGTSAAGGGELSLTDGTFAKENNQIKLTWTPGASDTKDGAGNAFGDIYNPTTGQATVDAGSDSSGIKVVGTSWTWTVKEGYSVAAGIDGKVDNNTAYGKSFTVSNLGSEATKVKGAWTNGTYFVLEDTTIITSTTGVELKAKNDTEGKDKYTFSIEPQTGKTANPGIYEDTLTLTDSKGNTATVHVVLIVKDKDEFTFEIDTYLNHFAPDTVSGTTTTPVAGVREQNSVTSVVLKPTLDTTKNSDVTMTEDSSQKGKYTGTLKTEEIYQVWINGYQTKWSVSKDSETLVVELYELAVAHTGTGSNPAKSPAGSADPTSGHVGTFYLEGQPVTLTPQPDSGNHFVNWTIKEEKGTSADTSSNSTTDPYTHIMGAQAIQFTANYAADDAVYTIVIDMNSAGSITYFTGKDHTNILTGGTVDSGAYKVNAGDSFGLPLPTTGTPASGQYSVTNTGYTFLGWATSSGAATGSYVFTADEAADTGDGEDDNIITLYPVWKANSDLAFTGVLITGTYKHAITATGGTATGGQTDYTFAGDPAFSLTIDTANGQYSGTPDDVGTEYRTVTVTDANGDKATATYTFSIGKADVKPSSSTTLPTSVTVAAADASNASSTILDKFNTSSVVMDGDGTGETAINGSWSVVGTVPTTPGTHKVTVRFTPANNTSATDDDRKKDGDHYNTYDHEIELTISNKLITGASLGTSAMKPAAGNTAKDLKWLRTWDLSETTKNTLTSTDSLAKYDTYIADGTYTTANDVEIVSLTWNPALPTTNNNTFDAGTTYTATVILTVREDSAYRFQTTMTGGKYDFTGVLAGDATNTRVVSVTDTVAVLQIEFPKDDTKVTKIHVTTTQPGKDAYSTTVGVLPDDAYKYTVSDPEWYEKGTAGTADPKKVTSSNPFKMTDSSSNTMYYDLVVTVTAKDGYVFDSTVFDKNKGDELKTVTTPEEGDPVTDWDARVTQGTDYTQITAPCAPSNAKVYTKLSEDGKTLTIIYSSFTPIEKKATRIDLTGALAKTDYYAITNKDKEKYTDSESASHDDIKTTGVVDHKKDSNDDWYTAIFSTANNFSGTIHYDDGSTDTITSTSTNYKLYYWDGSAFVALPANGYLFTNVTNGTHTTRDEDTFNGKDVYLGVESGGVTIVAPRSVGTLVVEELEAKRIVPSDSSKVTLHYASGTTVTFAADTDSLTASVDFNDYKRHNYATDTNAQYGLSHTVSGMTYSAATSYATLTPGKGEYFFEIGDAGKDGIEHTAWSWDVDAGTGTGWEMDTTDTDIAFIKTDAPLKGTSVDCVGKTIYISYLDVNNDIVRTAIGKVTMGSNLTVDVDDENGPDPEYGDKLTAWPEISGTRTDDPGDYEYQWEIKTWNDPEDHSQGYTWKPIPGATGQIYIPGKDDVGEEIRVTVYDPENDTTASSEEMEIMARSLNFVVSVQDKTEDGDNKNEHTYTADDFTPTKVLKKVTDSHKNNKNGENTIADSDLKNEPTFTAASPSFGGVLDGDSVTIAPNNNTWNGAEDKRPLYAGASVGDEITWPTVSENGVVTDREGDEKNKEAKAWALATKFSDYVLTSPKNTKGKDVYRFAAQDKQEHRGIIAGNNVVHVDVSFSDLPKAYEAIPGKPMGVTDRRETQPGVDPSSGQDTQDYTNSTAFYKVGDSFSASAFDPTDPTNTGVTSAAAGTTFQPGDYIVIVQVKPQTGYAYDLNTNNANYTRFSFHFGNEKNESLAVEVRNDNKVYAVDTNTEIGGAVGGLKESGGKYYMWYKFTVTEGAVLPPTFGIGEGGAGNPGPDADDSKYIDLSGVFYAKTQTTTEKHHWSDNDKADHKNNTTDNSIPGGKKDVGFTFDLTTAKSKVVALTLKVDYKGASTQLEAGNYGSFWRLGVEHNGKIYYLDDNTTVYGNKTFTDTAGNHVNGDSSIYDGKDIYVIVDGKVVGKGTGSGKNYNDNNVLGKLVVKQLEAESIEAKKWDDTVGKYVSSVDSSKLSYTVGDTFNTGLVSKVKIDFNTGTAVEPSSYTDAVYGAKGTTTTPASSNFYYEYEKFNETTKKYERAELTVSSTLELTDNGAVVYVCYKDVNGHVVETPIGKLSVTEASTAPNSTAVIYLRDNTRLLNTTITTVEGGNDYYTGAQYGDDLEAVIVGQNAEGDNLTIAWQRWDKTLNSGSGGWETVKSGAYAANKHYKAAKNDVYTVTEDALVRVIITAHTDSHNKAYTGTFSESDNVQVAPKELYVTWTWTQGSKQYDGNPTAAANNGQTGSSKVNYFTYDKADFAAQLTYGESDNNKKNDEFALTEVTAGAFNDANVGRNKPITITGGALPTNGGKYNNANNASPVYDWTKLYHLNATAPKGDITAFQLTWEMFTFTPKFKVYDGTTDVYKTDNFSTTIGSNTGDKLSGTNVKVSATDGLWAVDTSKVTDTTIQNAIKAAVKAINVAYTSADSFEGNVPLTAKNTPHKGHSTIELELESSDVNIVVPSGKYYISDAAINPIQVKVTRNDLTKPTVAMNANVNVTVSGVVDRTAVGSAETRVVAGEKAEFTVSGQYEKTTMPGEENVYIIGVTKGSSNGIVEDEKNYFFVWDDDSNEHSGTVSGNPASEAEFTVNNIEVIYGDPIPWSNFKLKAKLGDDWTDVTFSYDNLTANGLTVIYQDELGWHFYAGGEQAHWDSGSDTTATLPVKVYKTTDKGENTAAQLAAETDKVLATGTITVHQRKLTITPTWSLDKDGKIGKYYDGTTDVLSGVKDATGDITAADVTTTMDFAYANWAFSDTSAKASVANGYTAAFADAQAGDDKPITVTGTLTGDYANRYEADFEKAEGNIKPRPILVKFDEPTVPVDKTNTNKTVNLWKKLVGVSTNESGDTVYVVSDDTVIVSTTGTYNTVVKPITAGNASQGGVNNVTVSTDDLTWNNPNYVVTVVGKINGNVVEANVADDTIQHVYLWVTEPVAGKATNSTTAGEVYTTASVTSVITKQGTTITTATTPAIGAVMNSGATPAAKWYDYDSTQEIASWTPGTAVATGEKFESGKAYVAVIAGLDDKHDDWNFATNVDFSGNGSVLLTGGNSAIGANVLHPVKKVEVEKVIVLEDPEDEESEIANITYTVRIYFGKLEEKKTDLVVHGFVKTLPQAGQATSTSPIEKDGNTLYTQTSETDNWYTDPSCTADKKATTFEGGKTYYAKLTVTLTDDAQKSYKFTSSTKGFMNNETPNVSATADSETQFTIIHKFTVNRQQIVVHVGADAPTAGSYAYTIEPDVKIHTTYQGAPHKDEEHYDLSGDARTGYATAQGRWYEDDGTTLATKFEAGKTYRLVVTATLKDAKAATESLYTTVDGYEWVDQNVKATGIISSTPNTDNDGNKITKFYFAYTVQDAKTSTEIPGNANAPVAGQPLDPKGWTSENFDVVTPENEVIWYEGEVDKTNVGSATVATGNAAANSKYTAVITVKPKDGVVVADSAKYFFNSDDITAKDVAHEKNADGTYTLYYTFTTGEAPRADEQIPIPGYANRPSTGSVLGEIWTDNNKFTREDFYWTLADGTTVVANSTNASSVKAVEKTVYLAHIKVRPNDGVNVGVDGKHIYTFNSNAKYEELTSTLNDADFIGHEPNGNGTYTLIYRFPITAEKDTTIIEVPGGGGGGGGGGVTEKPVVTYWLGETGVTDDLTAEKVNVGKKPTKVPTVDGIEIVDDEGNRKNYKFLGWSETDPSKSNGTPTLVDPTTFKITKDKTFYAVYEIEGHTAIDHTHYVIGFPNGTFGPGSDITRAEVATIIARACLDGFVEGANYGNPGNYSDVERHWARSAIAYCSMNNVFSGYTDGTFKPNQPISRQELALVVARLAGLQADQGVPFTDADQISKWARDGVYTVYANGWIKGYTDGSFKPKQNITRAETVKIFNGYLNRGVDKEGLSAMSEYVHSGVASNNTENGFDQYMTWPDVPKNHWAYYEIIEAANDHTFYWLDEADPTPPEHWTSVWIDEVWLYRDNANDGAREENPDTQTNFNQ